MKLFFRSIALLLLLLAPFCANDNDVPAPQKTQPGDSRLTVTYIANEGVLIKSGNKQVLIDGLHREYKPDYAFPPPGLRKSLESVESPYHKIDLILVSHIHLDHFHSESVGLHLKNNPAAVLASSDQIVDALKKDFKEYSKIESRVNRLKHEWQKEVYFGAADIRVRALGLSHGSAHFSWIQNFGHVIEFDGKKLLHLGDADMTAENFASFRLAEAGIDVAFIPYCYLLSARGCAFVQSQFKPKQIIGLHISPADADSVTTRIKTTCPEATTFTKILESREY